MAGMSPVETLRAAAGRLRKCGEAAVTESPWRVVVDESAEDDTAVGVWSPEETFVFEDADTMRVDAEWIALVHPGVAGPLADWLDAQAEDLGWHMAAWTHVNPGEENGFFGQAARDPERLAHLTEDHSGNALRVARVLLGVPDGN